MKSSIIISIFLFVGGLLFVVLIYPIWALIHCATSQSRSNKSKTFWIIAMILIWPFSAIIYGLCASKKKMFQWISGILVVGCIIFLTASVYLIGRIGDLTKGQVTKAISKIDQMDTSELSKTELMQLKQNLFIIREDMKFNPSKTNKMRNAFIFMQFFETIAKDNKITHSEYSNWTAKFELRDSYDKEAFEKYLRDLRSK